MSRIVLVILVQLMFIINVNSQSTPYVILISLDGFRWDYSQRGITPNMEKIKETGVTAMSLRPAFPSSTFPNHYSIITGMYTENHGLISNGIWDPFTGEKFSMGTKDSKWFMGEAFWETAGRNGITTASFFWPGSEMDLDYRRPDYFQPYSDDKDYLERVDTVIYWLQLPDSLRPHFITLYFHDTDKYGHRYGPDSPEIDESIARVDSLIGELYTRLDRIGMTDSVNVIVTSDHGMTQMSKDRVINIASILSDYDCKIWGGGTMMSVECADEDRDDIYKTLLENRTHYRVFLKEDIPSFYHYSKHPFIPELMIFGDVGWSLEKRDTMRTRGGRPGGRHGYEKDHTDMHGTFIAKGPAFKIGYKTGTLWNIDIVPLLCEIYGIEPRSNIDGKLERIEFLLNGK
jgi:predicted AlkP superfamily pyrophosphatase or phosphodiesterase